MKWSSQQGKIADVPVPRGGKAKEGGDCKRALNSKGIYVTTAFSPTLMLQGKWASMTGSQRMIPMVPSPSGPGKNIMDQYKELVEAEKLTPVIDRRYPLSEVPEAFRYYAKGHAQGRVIITV